MRCFVQVLSPSTGDTTASLQIFFDNKRYLFNCGEGTQRLCTEHKIRLVRLGHMFMTRLTWDVVGGLPGLLLTAADAGVTTMNIMGPPGTSKFIQATRYFVYRRNLSLDIIEANHSGLDSFSDEFLTVWPVTIFPVGTEDQGHNASAKRKRTAEEASSLDITGPRTGRVRTLPMDDRLGHPLPPIPGMQQADLCADDNSIRDESMCVDDLERQHSAQHERESGQAGTNPRPSVASAAVCYVCQTVPVPGKFDMQKAKALGVPSGPMCGRLVRGESVVLPDGRVVNPDDCVGVRTPGPVIIVLDCPSETYLDGLVADTFLASFMPGRPGFRTAPQFIAHMAPADIVLSEKYRSWALSFGPLPQHIFLNAGAVAATSVFRDAAIIQARLHTADPVVYPLPFSETAADAESRGGGAAWLAACGYPPAKAAAGELLLRYNLLPQRTEGFDRSAVPPPLNLQDVQTETLAKPGYAELIARLREGRPIVSPTTVGAGVEVVILGTGSAMPSKYRNVSATLLRLADGQSILLDAGEGTYGQLFRRYGRSQIDSIVGSIRCIYISHMHADHHLGAVNILRIRQELVASGKLNLPDSYNEAPIVIGPGALYGWLREYASVCEPLQFTFVLASLLSASDRRRMLNRDRAGLKLDVNAATAAQRAAESAQSATEGGAVGVEQPAVAPLTPPSPLEVYAALLRDQLSLSAASFELERTNRPDANAEHADAAGDNVATVVVEANRDVHMADGEGATAVSERVPSSHGDSNACTHDSTKGHVCESDLPQKLAMASRSVLIPNDVMVRDAQRAYAVLRDEMGFVSVDNVPVIHCRRAYGLVLTHSSGWKMVYSGDTRPCPALIRSGMGATLLLHEATFDDELQSEAVEKAHSTISEALSVGREMRASTTVLTHFSQRYPKVPIIAESNGRATADSEAGKAASEADATRTDNATNPSPVANPGSESSSVPGAPGAAAAQGHTMHVALAFDLMTIELGNPGRAAQTVPAVLMLLEEAVVSADQADASGEAAVPADG